MGYTKVIHYGVVVETYEYEENLRYNGRTRISKRNQISTDSKDLESDRTDRTNINLQKQKRKDNLQRASLAFRRLVLCNLGKSVYPTLVTFTYAGIISDITRGYEDLKTFNKSLRDKYGKQIRYICVPEFQKRGSLHFHALYWGLPARLVSEERKTRQLANWWGQGFIYLKETDGNEKLSYYLTKYLSKSFTDPRTLRRKAYVTSRNILRSTTYKDVYVPWVILDDHMAVDNPPCEQKEYMTKWLGKGRYKKFNI